MGKIEALARDFEYDVREQFVKVYGAPPSVEAMHSVKSAYLADGARTRYTEARPDRVLVFTEYAWIEDPFSDRRSSMMWDTVAGNLKGKGWGDVRWDSINPAVHVMYVDLPEKTWKAMIPKAGNR